MTFRGPGEAGGTARFPHESHAGRYPAPVLLLRRAPLGRRVTSRGVWVKAGAPLAGVDGCTAPVKEGVLVCKNYTLKPRFSPSVGSCAPLQKPRPVGRAWGPGTCGAGDAGAGTTPRASARSVRSSGGAGWKLKRWFSARYLLLLFFCKFDIFQNQRGDKMKIIKVVLNLARGLSVGHDSSGRTGAWSESTESRAPATDQ